MRRVQPGGRRLAGRRGACRVGGTAASSASSAATGSCRQRLADVADDVVEVLPPGQHPQDRRLLGLDRVAAHQLGRVAEGRVRLLLLLQQPGQHPEVAGEAGRSTGRAAGW